MLVTGRVRDWKEHKEQKKRDFEAEKVAAHKETFLLFLRILGRVTKACKEAGLGRTTVYRWKNEDDAFREAWIENKTAAEDNRVEILEEAAYVRAVDGVRCFRYDKDGNTIYETTNYSDSLHKVLLQAEKPKKYRDKAEVEHTGRVILWDMPTEPEPPETSSQLDSPK